MPHARSPTSAINIVLSAPSSAPDKRSSSISPAAHGHHHLHHSIHHHAPPLHLGSSPPCVTISMTSTTSSAGNVSHYEARTMLAKMRSASTTVVPALPLSSSSRLALQRRSTTGAVVTAFEDEVEGEGGQKERLAKFDSGYISFPEFEVYEDHGHDEHEHDGDIAGPSSRSSSISS